MNHRKYRILTIPNALSLLRLCLIPVYIHMYLHAATAAQFRAAGLILALSCMTDMLDGWIARRFHQISTLGKILDPLADKLTQLALLVCLRIGRPSLDFVLGLFLLKECTQLLLGIIYLPRGFMLSGALPAGKISTSVLFVTLMAMVVFPDLSGTAVWAIAAVDVFFLSLAFLSYLKIYCSLRQNPPAPGKA